MVTLRDLTAEDFDALVQWRNDPTVNHYLADRLKSKEEIEAWFNRIKANPKTWLKTILNDGRLVGYGVVESIDEKSRKCELALVIGETDAWGIGIGQTVAKEMLRYAFEDLHMHRMLAVVARGNDRSERLIKKLGFVFEGTMREALLAADQFTDLLCFSMLENEYRGRYRL